MNPAAILLQDTSHPGMPGAAFGLSVCPALLPCAQAGVNPQPQWGCTHLSQDPSTKVTVMTCAYSWCHAETSQAIINRNWYCFSLTSSWWPLVGLTQVRQAADVNPQHNTEKQSREETKQDWVWTAQGSSSQSCKVLPFPTFCPFNHSCQFSQEFGHSYTEMPREASVPLFGHTSRI